MNKIQQIVQALELAPHPEGGYYKETYRSAGSIKTSSLDSEYEGERNYSTAIYYLLTSDVFSAFHRIHQDETWHFYDGSALDLHIISPDGYYQLIKIGREIEKGEVPQFTVKGGDWFGASVREENSYSLCGCTVAPGFDFRDFDMPDTEEFIKKFPQHASLIKSLKS